MSNFLQWLRAHEKGELKRFVYVCGSERSLVEEVVNGIRERALATTVVHIEESPWDELNQYGASGDTKLVIVRNAEGIDWEPFEAWATSRQLPHVYAVFVSNDDKVDTSKPHIQRFSKTGRYVRCSALEFEDAVKVVQIMMPDVAPEVARTIVRRSGSPIRAIGAVRKLLAIGQKNPPIQLIEQLVVPEPSQSFVDLLLMGKKAEALSVADSVDVSSVIGMLDYRLESLTRVNRQLARGTGLREIHQQTGVPILAVKEMLPYARFYDDERVRGCTRTLIHVDRYLQQGIHDGLAEVLVALW